MRSLGWFILASLVSLTLGLILVTALHPGVGLNLPIPPATAASGVETAAFDIFVNAVGGVRISEPAADLAVLAAIYSSIKNSALNDKSIVFGEVGLAGEIRPVQRGQERLREAAKLGFRRAIIPVGNRPKQAIEGMEIVAVGRIGEALERLRG